MKYEIENISRVAKKFDELFLAGKLDHALNFAALNRLSFDNADSLQLRLGLLFQRIENHEDAIKIFQKLNTKLPENSDILNNLSISFLAIGDLLSSENTLAAAIKLSPLDSNYRLNWCNILLQKGNYSGALQEALKLVSEGNASAQLMLILANILLKLSRYQTAKRTLKTLNSNSELHEQVMILMSQCEADLGDYKNAIRLILDDIGSFKNKYQGYLQLGIISSQFGEFSAAAKFYKLATEVNPACNYSFSQWIIYEQNFDNYAKIRKLTKRISNTKQVVPDLHYARAKLYNGLGKFNGAYNDFTLANAQLANTTKFSIDVETAKYSKLIELYGRFGDEIEPDLSIEPIFIIGMPRTGTTLLERILSENTVYTSLGELPYISQCFQSYSKQDLPVLSNLSNDYRTLVRETGFYGKFFIDKMPTNFRWLGFIKKAFPLAKFIWCQRNFSDVALSLLRQKFAVGKCAYSYDISNIYAFSKLHLKYMDFWINKANLHILRVDYEQFVLDNEQYTQNLINELEISFDQNSAVTTRDYIKIKTASNDAAREKVSLNYVNTHTNYDDIFSKYHPEWKLIKKLPKEL